MSDQVVARTVGQPYLRRFLLAWKLHGHEEQLDAYVVNYADDFVITDDVSPRFRLGPRTSSQDCVPSSQNSLKKTFHGITKRLHCGRLMQMLNSILHHWRKTPP
jgi:hypothetical protein